MLVLSKEVLPNTTTHTSSAAHGDGEGAECEDVTLHIIDTTCVAVDGRTTARGSVA